MITILSGGTGTPKLLQGFGDREDICIIVNIAEDMEQSGGYVSPDLDTVIYTLAGIVDENKWYGIRDDTFFTHEKMAFFGLHELLKIGDRDRGTKIARKLMLDGGESLTQITENFCRAYGIKARIFPASDRRIETWIKTPSGEKRFHEFWVRDRGKERVLGVRFEGIMGACAPSEALLSCQNSRGIVIGPSNPMTSINPIAKIKDWAKALEKKKVVAVSPFIGKNPFSGPAGSLLRGCGYEPNPFGVACVYKDFLDVLVIHSTDTSFRKAIEDLGIEVLQTNIIMNTAEQKRTLADFLEGIL